MIGSIGTFIFWVGFVALSIFLVPIYGTFGLVQVLYIFGIPTLLYVKEATTFMILYLIIAMPIAMMYRLYVMTSVFRVTRMIVKEKNVDLLNLLKVEEMHYMDILFLKPIIESFGLNIRIERERISVKKFDILDRRRSRKME